MRHLRRAANAANLITIAVVAAVGAAAALETAIIPGVIIGAAAMLAPRQITRLRRRGPRKAAVRTVVAEESVPAQHEAIGGLHLGRAAVKTATFRVISSSLDFGWNYFLLGEVATAAGLSAFSLAAAPVFYFLHEAAWNRLRQAASEGAAPSSSRPKAPEPADKSQISQAIAKTITFRTFATISEFGTNYVVVRDVALAINLSAFGFFAGPFVYLAHEKAWEYYWPREADAGAANPARMLPTPAPLS